MILNNTTGAITTVQLRRLLKELYEHSPQTKIRFRLIGKLWESRFLKIVHVTAADSLVVQDDKAEQMKKLTPPLAVQPPPLLHLRCIANCHAIQQKIDILYQHRHGQRPSDRGNMFNNVNRIIRVHWLIPTLQIKRRISQC